MRSRGRCARSWTPAAGASPSPADGAMSQPAFEALLRRNRKLEALNAEYRALVEVAAAIGSTLDVQSVLDVIVDRCRVLLGAGAAGVFRFDADEGALIYDRGSGLSPDFIGHLTVRPGEGTTGLSYLEQRAVWTIDILADGHVRLGGSQRALVEREGYRAVLSVPIVIKGKPYGALAVYWWES